MLLIICKERNIGDALSLKNGMVPPMSGNPMEPGGSFPLHLGFLHLYTQ